MERSNWSYARDVQGIEYGCHLPNMTLQGKPAVHRGQRTIPLADGPLYRDVGQVSRKKGYSIRILPYLTIVATDGYLYRQRNKAEALNSFIGPLNFRLATLHGGVEAPVWVEEWCCKFRLDLSKTNVPTCDCNIFKCFARVPLYADFIQDVDTGMTQQRRTLKV